jgi:hypothetical protein
MGNRRKFASITGWSGRVTDWLTDNVLIPMF